MHDLAVVIVSTNEAHWLRRCLPTILEHAGAIDLDVVVADNESTDGGRELIEEEFPWVRVVTCKNRGFAHANNRGLQTCDARYVLFLNPDTEILEGTFEDLVRALDARQTIGLVGVKQVTPDGALAPTIRRFPNALRTLCEALGSERFPIGAGSLGERELRMDLYEREFPCDWTSGSFMLARREALESAGFMDERFFIYSEEPDLCLRIKQSGWEIRHIPTMTILHHYNKAGVSPKLQAQDTFARLQYASKHFSLSHRCAYRSTLGFRYVIRFGLASLPPGSGELQKQKLAASVWALKVVLGRSTSPFGQPPGQAVQIREASTAGSPRSESTVEFDSSDEIHDKARRSVGMCVNR